MNPDSEREEMIEKAMERFIDFCEINKRKMRKYQLEIARAVLATAYCLPPFQVVAMLPRQSGKNELQAYLEAFLLYAFAREGLDIVKISPTWKPQSLNAMRRLERILSGHPYFKFEPWFKESGYIYRVGQTRISFFSGEPSANIVGATASLLLEVDEAQSVSVEKFDTQIAPMGAATNTPCVFWGTAWTPDTLLARVLRTAQQAEAQDGIRRVFRRKADDVGQEVPAYALYVAGEVERLGRDSVAVRTQYFSEEVEARNALFPRESLAMAAGEHAWLPGPQPGEVYAFLVDVGGEAAQDSGQEERRRHDSSALVVVRVEAAPGGACYRVVHLRQWQGEGQPLVQAQLQGLARSWNTRLLVVDATGLGAGLAAGLERALPGKVRRFIFSASSKSRLGWDFVALVENGRFLLPRTRLEEGGDLVERLRLQMASCEQELGGGPEKALRWEVPARVRGPDGAPLHDDLLTAAALCCVLDETHWPLPGGGQILPGRDPLQEMDRF